MKKSDDYWKGFYYGSFIGIFAGIAIIYLIFNYL
jgi:hypothetical protein